MTDVPFGFGLPGGPDPNDPAQMQRFMAQLQMLLAGGGSGPVNWDLARQVAMATLTGGGSPMGMFGLTGEQAPQPVGDPRITGSERAAVVEALRLADLWLEPAATLPSGVVATAAWTRTDWINHTLPVWRTLCDPVAARMVTAMGELIPEEMRGQLGPMQSMVTTIGGTLFGAQLGQALASLAAEVLSAGDIGLPLGPSGTAALLPANITSYGEGLEIDPEQVRLYVALREAAHQRLFGHVSWLRAHVLNAVEAYANGIRVNRDAVEEAMGRFDPTNPEAVKELSIEGIFTPEDSPAQRAALNRLETALALIEGWVCQVVDTAADGRLPDVARLSEAFRRRRAAGGPAEQTFAALVGLQLRPRRLREATALWSALAEHRGIAGRDALWGHPDLLPDEDAFADPVGFATAEPEAFDLDQLDFPPADQPPGTGGSGGPAGDQEPGGQAGTGPDRPGDERPGGHHGDGKGGHGEDGPGDQPRPGQA